MTNLGPGADRLLRIAENQNGHERHVPASGIGPKQTRMTNAGAAAFRSVRAPGKSVDNAFRYAQKLRIYYLSKSRAHSLQTITSCPQDCCHSP